MKHPFTFNCFIAMILSHQISRVFMRNLNRQDVMGNRAGQREREREHQIRGEREGVLVGKAFCGGQKWPLVKWNT
jgi:hypothetical protein